MGDEEAQSLTPLEKEYRKKRMVRPPATLGSSLPGRSPAVGASERAFYGAKAAR